MQENIEIVRNLIILTEIPDELYRVRIPGYTEIHKGHPKENEFKVNYRIGLVEFNESQNGKSVQVEYKGRGIIMYPASRIYYEDGDVVTTLKELIIKTELTIEEAEIAIERAYEAAGYAQLQGDYAKKQGDYAKEQGEYAKEQGEYAETIADNFTYLGLYDEEKTYYPRNFVMYGNTLYMCLQECTGIPPTDTEYWIASLSVQDAIDNANQAADYATDQGNYAKQQGDYALSQGNHAKIQGDRASVAADSAILAGEYAIEQGHYAKAQGDYAKAQGDLVNEQLTDLTHAKTRYMVFVIPYKVEVGVQDVFLRFPYDGKITSIIAYCITPPQGDTYRIQIQKIHSDDYDPSAEWKYILDSGNEIVFRSGSVKPDENIVVTDPDIVSGDLFRIFVLDGNETMQDLTVQIGVAV